MSISSACSSISVSLNGKEVDLEQGLDEVVRGLQKHLNQVQLQLRMLGVGSERDDDYQEMIKEADIMEDGILEMQNLFDDLRSMSYQIVGLPETKEEKSWLKNHKIERKTYLQQKALDRKEEKNVKNLRRRKTKWVIRLRATLPRFAKRLSRI